MVRREGSFILFPVKKKPLSFIIYFNHSSSHSEPFSAEMTVTASNDQILIELLYYEQAFVNLCLHWLPIRIFYIKSHFLFTSIIIINGMKKYLNFIFLKPHLNLFGNWLYQCHALQGKFTS